MLVEISTGKVDVNPVSPEHRVRHREKLRATLNAENDDKKSLAFFDLEDEIFRFGRELCPNFDKMNLEDQQTVVAEIVNVINGTRKDFTNASSSPQT